MPENLIDTAERAPALPVLDASDLRKRLEERVVELERVIATAPVNATQEAEERLADEPIVAKARGYGVRGKKTKLRADEEVRKGS